MRILNYMTSTKVEYILTTVKNIVFILNRLWNKRMVNGVTDRWSPLQNRVLFPLTRTNSDLFYHMPNFTTGSDELSHSYYIYETITDFRIFLCDNNYCGRFYFRLKQLDKFFKEVFNNLYIYIHFYETFNKDCNLFILWYIIIIIKQYNFIL